MKLLLMIRTANRSPKPNYLGQTVRSLLAGGASPGEIHIVPTDTEDTEWIARDFSEQVVTVSPGRRTPNQNGLAQIALLDQIEADWIVLSEDDLEWCADPIGSMARWLEDYAQPDVMVYRFFAFDRLTPLSAHAAKAPLREMKGSQVVAMRAGDARRFAAWARLHPLDWRPKDAPFQNQPHTGFDKLIGYWALRDRPDVTHGLVSRPFFVKHLGIQSSLHRFGAHRNVEFAGTGWSYRAEVPA